MLWLLFPDAIKFKSCRPEPDWLMLILAVLTAGMTQMKKRRPSQHVLAPNARQGSQQQQQQYAQHGCISLTPWIPCLLCRQPNKVQVVLMELPSQQSSAGSSRQWTYMTLHCWVCISCCSCTAGPIRWQVLQLATLLTRACTPISCYVSAAPQQLQS